MVAHILGGARGPRHPKNLRRQRGLIVQLVQYPPLLALRGADRRAGDDEQRNGIGVGLSRRGQDVGHAGPGNDEADGGPATQASIAIRGEACTLFVTHQDMPQTTAPQAPIQLETVHAGNAEHRIDVVRRQEFDQECTDVARHVSS
jgi:hypothetical protein